MKQTIFRSALLLLMMAAMMPMRAEIYSGDCGAQGDNVKWELNTETGELTISGNGEMKDPDSIVNGILNLWHEKDLVSFIHSAYIGDGITNIGNWLFSGCTELTTIRLPETLERIGHDAFSGCCSLAEIKIPESVRLILRYAFDGCVGLTKAEFTNLYCLLNMDFDLISSNPLIHAGHLYIDGKEFTEVNIPDGITAIKPCTFAGCRFLSSITIPESVTSIGDYAFFGCSGLPVIDGLRYVDTYLVEAVEKDKTEYSIKEGTKIIGSGVFADFSNLTSVTIPNSVTSIGYNAFLGCSNLTSVTIPNSVTSIEDYAFCSSGLTSIKIPDNVTEIGCYAFCDCKSLQQIDLSGYCGTIGECAFNMCTHVKEFILSDDNPKYYVYGTGVYSHEQKLVTHFTPEGEMLVIPYPVTSTSSSHRPSSVISVSPRLSCVEFPCSWSDFDIGFSVFYMPERIICRCPLPESFESFYFDGDHIPNDIYVLECDSLSYATKIRNNWNLNVHVLKIPNDEMMVEEFVRNNGIFDWASIVENAPGNDVEGYFYGKDFLNKELGKTYPQYFTSSTSDLESPFMMECYERYFPALMDDVRNDDLPPIMNTIQCMNGKAYELDADVERFAKWYLDTDTVYAWERNKNYDKSIGYIEEVQCDESYGVPNNTYWLLKPETTINPREEYFLHMVPNMPYRIHALFAPNIDTIVDDWGYCKVKCTLNINAKNETGEIMPLESDEINFRTDRMMDVVLFDGVYTPNFTNNSIEIQSIPKPAEIRKGYLREIPLVGFWAEPLEEYDLSTGMKPVWQPPYAKDDDAIYNLNGQKIVAPQKGIYIQNGRKILKQ